MNIYKIECKELHGYDEYDSAVVVCRNEEQARRTHPCGVVWKEDGWKDHGGYKVEGEWPDPKDVIVTLVGHAVEGIEQGVIVASFNAA